MITFCADCVFCNKGAKHCLKLDVDVNLDTDGCLIGSHELPHICDVCNRYVNGHCTLTEISTGSGEWVGLCQGCASKLGQCETCKTAKECLFETSPINLPKTVQRQIQNGPMIQIVQVRNPDRIAETCAKGCPCYQNEQCGRETGFCAKWNFICSQ